MRIPDHVLHELQKQPQLTFTDRSVYLWCFIYQPRTVREAATKLRLPWRSVATACDSLAATEWMTFVTMAKARRPVPLTPLRCQSALALQLEKNYAQAPNKGEFLMKSHLDLRIQSDQFVDNARPEFLTRKTTDQPLEYDRFYTHLAVAFEFNGSQHFLATQAFGDEQAQKEIIERDLIKESLSRNAGVRLIVVTADDLRPGVFERLLPDDLPQYHVDEDGPYYQALARISTAYADKTGRQVRQQQRARAGARG
ncbi:MAG: hypothetical protein Q8P31_02915 [Bacillota bacterium]|nr:hypothetical protein [Bacillota bacterium]